MFEASDPSAERSAAFELRAIWVSLRALRNALAHSTTERDVGDVGALLRVLDERLEDSDELLIAAMPSARMEWDRMRRLVESLMPDEIPQPVELLQARREAQMRRDMLARLGYYSAEELADLHGSRAKNRYALAARWMREGKIFGVPLGARTVFPAFQFDSDGAAFPIIARVLRALPRADMSPWAVGLWWFTRNPLLPGEARPAELVGTRDEPRIVDAAQRLAEPLPL